VDAGTRPYFRGDTGNSSGFLAVHSKVRRLLDVASSRREKRNPIHRDRWPVHVLCEPVAGKYKVDAEEGGKKEEEMENGFQAHLRAQISWSRCRQTSRSDLTMQVAQVRNQVVEVTGETTLLQRKLLIGRGSRAAPGPDAVAPKKGATFLISPFFFFFVAPSVASAGKLLWHARRQETPSTSLLFRWAVPLEPERGILWDGRRQDRHINLPTSSSTQ